MPTSQRQSSSDPRLPGLSVVLPCFDEEPNVERAVQEALAGARKSALAVQVVVVDDGSSDATGAIAEELAHADPHVTVVRHAENRGYGAAVRSGIAATTMPWVLLTDADLQFDVAEVERMLAAAGDHEVVAGYRIARQDPVHRRMAAHAWNWLMRRTFGIDVRDVDCAFKLVDGPALRTLELRSEGAMISTELYALAARAGWSIAEVGVHHRPRRAGVASGGDPRVILRAFRERRELARALAGQRSGAEVPAPALRRSEPLGL
ncbi:MAG: glycosyltransferase family 2 protein [Solirubrobacteraceae bacterium]